MHAYWRPRSLTCARTICALRFVIDGGRHRRAVAEPEETGHHDIAIGFELGRRHIGPCKRSEAPYAIAVKGGLRLEPLCHCRISASLRQNLIEQAAIHLVRSEAHTSDLQYLMRTSYAAFCCKTKHTNHIIEASTLS